jgi:hypothetical protein
MVARPLGIPPALAVRACARVTPCRARARALGTCSGLFCVWCPAYPSMLAPVRTPVPCLDGLGRVRAWIQRAKPASAQPRASIMHVCMCPGCAWHVCMCACMCVHVCAHALARACMCAPACLRVRLHVRPCAPACARLRACACVRACVRLPYACAGLHIRRCGASDALAYPLGRTVEVQLEGRKLSCSPLASDDFDHATRTLHPGVGVSVSVVVGTE